VREPPASKRGLGRSGPGLGVADPGRVPMPALRGAPEWVGVQSQGRCRNGFRRVVHVDIRRLVSRHFDSAQSTSFWRELRTARGFPRAPSIMGGEAGRSLMDGAGRILRKRAAISFETIRAQASMARRKRASRLLL